MTLSSMPMELSLCPLFQGDGSTAMLLKEPDIFILKLQFLICIILPVRMLLIPLPPPPPLFKNPNLFNTEIDQRPCRTVEEIEGWMSGDDSFMAHWK